MKSILRPRTAHDLANVLLLLLDALAFFSLWSTGEVQLWVFAVVMLIALFSTVSRFRLPDQLMVSTLFAVILGAIGYSVRAHVHPIWAAAHATPLFHSFLWLSTNAPRFRSWRVGVGFIGLVLAAALTPEFHIFVLIIVFIVLCSLAASSIFLDATLSARAPLMAKRELPRGFIRYSLAISGIIFLTSLIIFPILPRARLGTGLGIGKSDIGYREEVNSSAWTEFRADGQDRTVMRIFMPKSFDDRADLLPFPLLRGKVLEHFDGKNWMAVTKMTRETVRRDKYNGEVMFEVISEPMSASVLLVPYGTKNVVPVSAFANLRHLETGEWAMSQGSSQKRMQYFFDWNPLPKYKVQGRDEPREVHTRLVSSLAVQTVDRILRKIKIKSSPEEKIKFVQDFFVNGNYKATLKMQEVANADALSYFLEQSHEGHCELFASAAALLLRRLGVPSRLVVGFRLSRSPSNGVIIVNNTDAHAWLEAYTPRSGWVPLDPTPRIMRVGSNYWDWINNIYASLSAYWFRYVLSFDAEAQFDLKNSFTQNLSRRDTPGMELGSRWNWLKNILSGVMLLGAVILSSIILWKLIQWLWMGGRKQKLFIENRQEILRRLLRKKLSLERRSRWTPSQGKAWERRYQEHRYGPQFNPDKAKTELTRILKGNDFPQG